MSIILRRRPKDRSLVETFCFQSFNSMLPFSHHSCTTFHHLLVSTQLQLSFHRFFSFVFSNTIYSNLLALSSNVQSLCQTKQCLAFGLLNGFLPRDVSLCASLIIRYATFHDPAACRYLFEQTVCYSRSAFLWNTLIRGLLIAGVDDGFETYNRMVRNGVLPDDHTFPFILKACASNLNVQKGLEIHGIAFKLGFHLDIYLANTLLLLYGKCGNLREAKRVFDEMLERDVVSWNTIIGVFSANMYYMEALDLFSEMNLRSGFRPNVVSIVSALPVCARLEDEVMVQQIHCYVEKAGLDAQVNIRNSLIDAYGKCENLKASRQIFDEMAERNGVSWNAIITSLAYLGNNKDALEVFRLMIIEGMKPNPVTISSMLPVLVDLELFYLGKQIHGCSLRFGYHSDVFVANSLIDMYAKSNQSAKASNVFHQMGGKNVVSWNAMIANYAQNGLELAAIELVRQMQGDGETPTAVTFTNVLPACGRIGFLHPGKQIHARSIRMGCYSDIFVSNALADMYAKCGCLDLAQNVFNISLKDEISYNILIIGYSQTTNSVESLNLFSEMWLMGLKPDVVSYMGVLSACANIAALKQGKEIHGLIVRKHLPMHLFIANSLLDFYTKCGQIDIASKIFDRIPDKDAASWNTMILGYGMRGELKTAINLFEAMKEGGVEYDSISYIAVLSACSHGGLVENGKKYFKEMQAQNIEPTQMHYSCMVDLLGRAGLMEEAARVIKSMPFEPNANVWGALLGASRIHGNIKLACWAAEHLFKLKPQDCGYYAVLSNMYAEVGKWDEAHQVRELMKSRGSKKNPGCSWVEIDDQVHAFVAGEKLAKLDTGLWFAES